MCTMGEKSNFDDCLYGTVTVGERGQIVIPADARRDLNIKQGDKLLIMRHPVTESLMVGKMEAMLGFFEFMTNRLKNVEDAPTEES